MKKLLLATMLIALASGANAAAINNLSIQTIPDPDVVPQSQSAPCIICATNQAHNPVGFGYNNFDSQGNDSTFNLFSTNITGALANGVQGTPYTSGQLVNFLQNNFTFGVAIDINTTGAKSEHLDFFQLINLGLPGTGDETVIFDIRNVDLPGIHNGNGAADYLLTGFNLTGLNVGDRLLFRAAWSHAVDGGESFYLVAQPLSAVPIPAVGAGLPGIIAGVAAWIAFKRRRQRLTAVAV